MSKRSKNLIFIFNETDVDYDNSSSLVRLYMNRGIINEDDQFEILGVGYLRSKTNGNIESSFEKIIEMHANISSRILNNSMKLKNADIHLIVGNIIINDSNWDYSNWDFYQDYYRYFEYQHPIKPHLISNKFKKLSSYTLLNENRNRLRQSKDLDVLQIRSKRVKPLTINPDDDLFFENLSLQTFKKLKFKFKNLGCFPAIRRRRHRINEWSIPLQRFKLLSPSEMQRVEKEIQSLTRDQFAFVFANPDHKTNVKKRSLPPFLNSLRVKKIPATLRYFDNTEEEDIEYSHVEYVGLRFTYFKADPQNDLEFATSSSNHMQLNTEQSLNQVIIVYL